jgi:hypothetical protein
MLGTKQQKLLGVHIQAGDVCPVCAAQLVYMGREVCCPTCQAPVAPEHPLQVQLDAEWRARDERDKADADRRIAAMDAENERLAAAADALAKEMETCGGRLHSLDAIVGPTEYEVTLGLRLPLSVFQKVRDEITRREAEIGERALAEFLKDPSCKRVATLRRQLGDSKRELAAAQKEVDAAMSAHQAAIQAGNVPEKLRSRLVSVAEKLAVLKQEVADVEAILATAEAETKKAYDAAYQTYEAGVADRQHTAARQALAKWLECALPGLPELLVETFIHRNLIFQGIDKRIHKRPLVIPE